MERMWKIGRSSRRTAKKTYLAALVPPSSHTWRRGLALLHQCGIEAMRQWGAHTSSKVQAQSCCRWRRPGSAQGAGGGSPRSHASG